MVSVGPVVIGGLRVVTAVLPSSHALIVEQGIALFSWVKPMVKIILLLLLVLPGALNAAAKTLSQGKGYVVPEGKVWLIKRVPPARCKVCTADVDIRGRYSNVEVDGVVFHGSFSFSVSIEAHGDIKLYAGTQLWLGDSRSELVVIEKDL